MTRGTPAKAPRQTKTPRQRAEEALGVAQRAVDRLTAARDKLASELAGVESDLADADRRLTYVSTNPDLQEADQDQLALDDLEDGAK